MLNNGKKRKLRELLSKLDPKEEAKLLAKNLEEDIKAVESKLAQSKDYSPLLLEIQEAFNKLRANIANRLSNVASTESLEEVKQKALEGLEILDDKLSTTSEELKSDILGANSDIEGLKEKIEEDMQDLKKSFTKWRTEISSSMGGGSMNRQIKVNGVDVLKKYTDINFIGSITATADDTDKNVDLDFSLVGGVDTVSNSDGTLIISPTTGNVVASLNLNNANTWTALQTFSGGINPGFTTGSVIFQGASGIAQDNTNLFWDDTNNRLGIGTATPQSKLQIGSQTPASTVTPDALSLGATYGTTLTNGLKLNIYDDGVTKHGVGAIANNLYFLTTDAVTDFTINTSNTERLRVLGSNGNVGIGTPAPTEILDIRGAALRISSSNTTGILALGNYEQGAGYYDTGIYRGTISGGLTSGNVLNLGGYGGINIMAGNYILGSQVKVADFTATGGIPKTIFYSDNTSSDVAYVQSRVINGYSSFGMIDYLGTTRASFGYGNPSASSPLTDRVFFNAVSRPMGFSTNNGSNNAITIDTAGVVQMGYNGGAGVIQVLNLTAGLGSSSASSLTFSSAYSTSWITGRVAAISTGYGVDYKSDLTFSVNAGASPSNEVEAIRITSALNVGIANSSPRATRYGGLTIAPNGGGSSNKADLLPVLTTSSLTYDSSGTPSVNKWALYENSGGAVYGMGISTSGFDFLAGDNGFAFYTGLTNVDGTGASRKMTILNGGNVGIGIASPGAKLGINHVGVGDSYEWIKFYQSGAVVGSLAGDSTNNAFVIRNSSGNDKVTIQQAGNVGIGTTAPDGVLEVNLGTAGAFRLTYNDANGSASVYNDFTVSSSGILTINPTGNVVQVPRGGASTFANVGGTIFDYFTDVGNVTTGEDDLYSSTLDASLFGTNGDKVTATYQGVFVGAAASTQELRLYFGGTKIYDSGALAIGVATNNWTVNVTCIRVSSSVVRCSVSLSTDFGTLFPYSTYTEVTGLTLTNTQVLKLTGEAAGVGALSNQIISKLGYVEFKSAA